MNKSMDPKLRRMMSSMKDMGRLRSDFRAGAVMSAEGLAEDQLSSPEELSVRTLAILKAGKLPEGYEDLQWSHLSGDIYSVTVPLPRLGGLAESDEMQYVEMGRGFGPFLETSLAETRADRVHNPSAGETPFRGSGVVVGIIDFGFDYRLDDFRNEDGTTRVAFLWDQGLTAEGEEQSPANFPFGVEYDRDWIDDALAGTREIRHEFGAESHGTHVAGIAAGNGRSADDDFASGQFVGAAPESTIIFVHPNTQDQDASFTDSVHVSEAIAYIFERADFLGMPCVINMSLGQNGGSHDGESVVERAIDQLLENPGRAFISAAGNEHIWRGHSSGQLSPGETRALRWKMGGEIPWPFPPFSGSPLPQGQIGDFTNNEMEIWLSSRDEVRVRVISPDGEATEFVAPDESLLETLSNGNQVFIDSERFTVLNGEARVYVEVSPAAGGLVEEGVWEVEIEGQDVRSGVFDAFIERDARRHIIRIQGTEIQNFFADQSFFVGTDFDNRRTLGTPATARRSIAVANYDHNVQEPAPSSSRGRTRDGRDKPEVAAPGTNIVSSNSRGGELLSNGDAVPVRTTKSGTSMAAPHVAGIAALMLEKQPDLTAAQIEKILIAAAEPPAGVDVFDIAWGFGRVDARRSVDLVQDE